MNKAAWQLCYLGQVSISLNPCHLFCEMGIVSFHLMGIIVRIKWDNVYKRYYKELHLNFIIIDGERKPRERKRFAPGYIWWQNCPGLLTPSPVPVCNTMWLLHTSCLTRLMFRESEISNQSGFLSRKESFREGPVFTVDPSSILHRTESIQAHFS